MAHPLPLTDGPVQVRVVVPVSALVLAAWIAVALARDHSSVPGFAAMWIAMSVAMMIPTTLRPMMRAAQGSLSGACRFAAGFLAVWIAAGIPTFLVMNAVEWTTGWLAAAWVVAGAYQLTPVMQRNLMTCRSVRFTGSASAYGVRQGGRCVVSCWPLMLAVMVTAMTLPGTLVPLLLLVGVTALLCWEKRPRTTTRAVAAVGMTVLLLAAGGAVLFGGGEAGPHHSAGSSRS